MRESEPQTTNKTNEIIRLLANKVPESSADWRGKRVKKTPRVSFKKKRWKAANCQIIKQDTDLNFGLRKTKKNVHLLYLTFLENSLYSTYTENIHCGFHLNWTLVAEIKPYQFLLFWTNSQGHRFGEKGIVLVGVGGVP